MNYEYTHGFPYEKLKSLIKDEDVDELWLAFAYFSKDLVLDILDLMKKRNKKSSGECYFFDGIG
ncbi:MAG: hypothetical protein Q9O24_10390 [Gammaproteobacteria bacterium]|nr:hypothetical protein [Gammaproteobacteria bacterium]